MKSNGLGYCKYTSYTNRGEAGMFGKEVGVFGGEASPQWMEPCQFWLVVYIHSSRSNAWVIITLILFFSSDVSFDPKGYIDKDWQWVGPGKTGSTKLNSIEEYREGQVETQYLGVIFKGSSPDEQMGLAAMTIAAGITTTPAAPAPDFKPDFNKQEALLYAKLSQLAYQPYSTVQAKLSEYHLQADFQIYDQKTDTNGFIASDSQSVIVAFRGTNIKSWKNIFTDAWFFRERIIPGRNTLAHNGFITAFNSVYESIANELQPNLGKKKLFITGHSLGGALASLLMYRLTLEHSEAQPTMYVYGCPPVGDISLSTYFKERPSNTITIQNDPVSSGTLILLGPWVGLYKPVVVKFLPKAAGHGINDYITQLENLSQ